MIFEPIGIGFFAIKKRLGILRPKNYNWNRYYEKAEKDSEEQYKKYFKPYLSQFNISRVLDFACGRGRIAQYFLREDNKLVLCDISKSAIDSCRHRFQNFNNVTFLINTDSAIPLENGTITFCYSWDAMVHFELEDLAAYFKEFKRVLEPGGKGMVHHSNYGADGKRWIEHPHLRSGVSAGDVHRICDELDLIVDSQKIIDWGVPNLNFTPNLDCITTFSKKNA
ncbi:Ubiquinone/menaquinone biosynthesis C-methyltransferase UbiE [uncultured archaeon]|nr:Ubiquinone/menaquinone biosynthesis C-methyltransferase UbiE [uncultured archaeon]